jgi:hypothetical protein
VGGGARGRASGEGVVGLAAARARSWWQCAAAVRAAAAGWGGGGECVRPACRAPVFQADGAGALNPRIRYFWTPPLACNV